MKDVKEFATYVAEHLFDARPELKKNHEVEVKEMIKNNSTVLTGLIIKEVDSNIAPTIYMNSGFEMYQDGTLMEELIEDYLRTYETNKLDNNVSVEFFTDFEQAKERLTMKLVNAEKNRERLKKLPHYLLGDLALIFQVQVEAAEFGTATITVQNEHINMWKKEIATLFDNAKRNMSEKQPVRIQSMFDVLSSMMGGITEEMFEEINLQMYVLSNETKINAASGIIFTEKIQEFADVHEANLFILPSSIHELILIPDSGELDVEYLANMVREINATQVPPEEVLSDKVYYYDRNQKALMFADSMEIISLIES